MKRPIFTSLRVTSFSRHVEYSYLDGVLGKHNCVLGFSTAMAQLLFEVGTCPVPCSQLWCIPIVKVLQHTTLIYMHYLAFAVFFLPLLCVNFLIALICGKYVEISMSYRVGCVEGCSKMRKTCA